MMVTVIVKKYEKKIFQLQTLNFLSTLNFFHKSDFKQILIDTTFCGLLTIAIKVVPKYFKFVGF